MTLRVCIGSALIEEAVLPESEVGPFLDHMGKKYGHIPGLGIFIEDALTFQP